MPALTQHKYGKILFVFCGGGCKAVIQAFAAAELVRAGLCPSHIVSSSAGTCNALGFVESPGLEGAAKTVRIWEDYITSPEAIYEFHPFLRDKTARLLGVAPHVTVDKLPDKSRLGDFKKMLKFLSMVVSLCVRIPLRVAGRMASFALRLLNTFGSPQHTFRGLVESPEVQQTFDEVNRYFELQHMKAFFDPLPLLGRLGEQIDLQKVLTSPIVWHILAERYEDGATVVFSNKDHDVAGNGVKDARRLKARHDLFFARIRASMALYPLFEMVEMGGSRYLDADLANPLPVEEIFRVGCDTVFILLNVPRQTVRLEPHPLRDLVELNVLMRLNERCIQQRILEAQVKAKELGVNLFVIRPDEIPAGLGLLSIDRKVIEGVKTREQHRMREYLANLDAHNLRLAPLIT